MRHRTGLVGAALSFAPLRAFADMLETPRLKLCPWGDRHRSPFAEMHADLAVMADQGEPIDRQASDQKLARYVDAWREHGIGRWAVEHRDGTFLGYAGVMHHASPSHPLGPHFEVGWRLVRDAWGYGYATESAQAALEHAIREIGLTGIVAYTSAENLRSQAVMARLELRRDASSDFTIPYARPGPWHGLVWRVPTL